jgi:dTMP kinase
MSARGKLITLEGVDGAGKSTHVQYIADAVGAGGRHVVVTREPGGTALAEKLRKAILEEPMDPVAATLLVFAARADHVARVIRPALEAGSWVVCDRFTDATYAYQGGGQGVSFELIGRLGDAAHPGLRPDRTLLFDCSYEIARKRLSGSGKTLDRFEGESREFFQRVRDTYLARARAEPDRWRVVDASGDQAQIRRAVEQQLKF